MRVVCKKYGLSKVQDPLYAVSTQDPSLRSATTSSRLSSCRGIAPPTLPAPAVTIGRAHAQVTVCGLPELNKSMRGALLSSYKDWCRKTSIRVSQRGLLYKKCGAEGSQNRRRRA